MTIELFVGSGNDDPLWPEIAKNVVIGCTDLMKMKVFPHFNECNHFEVHLLELGILLEQISLVDFQFEVLFSLKLD